MATMVLLRGLIFLCLIHLCVQEMLLVTYTVSTGVVLVLAVVVQYFYNNVQPTTQQQTDAQYAMAINLPVDQFTDEGFDILTVFSREDADCVKEMLNKGEKSFFCTSSGNVIATRPDLKTKEHAEHILLYPLGNSPMDKLIANADQDTVEIFYSYYSPCMKTCLQSKDNILDGLSNWINKRKEGLNIFVFQEIWHKDINKNLEEAFRKINKSVHLYRCKIINNVMECRKCVENDIVDPFCLPEKK